MIINDFSITNSGTFICYLLLNILSLLKCIHTQNYITLTPTVIKMNIDVYINLYTSTFTYFLLSESSKKFLFPIMEKIEIEEKIKNEEQIKKTDEEKIKKTDGEKIKKETE